MWRAYLKTALPPDFQEANEKFLEISMVYILPLQVELKSVKTVKNLLP